jgi:hypothetical protein
MLHIWIKVTLLRHETCFCSQPSTYTGNQELKVHLLLELSETRPVENMYLCTIIFMTVKEIKHVFTHPCKKWGFLKKLLLLLELMIMFYELL